MTEREYKDIIALVHDHEVTDSDEPETINGAYLSKLCAENWGIYKTFTVNILNVIQALSSYELEPSYREIVHQRLEKLLRKIEAEPKSTSWKIRARIGENVKWYESPEEDKKVVNDRLANSG